jgi:hypothetical protein
MLFGTLSSKTIIVAAAALVVGTASLSTEALAFRGGARGVYRGHAYGGHYGYHGGYAYRRGYWRPGVAGAAAVGVAVGAAAAGSYYDSAACGYYPRPPCY